MGHLTGDASDIAVLVGIGTGDTGQYLAELSDGRYAIVDDEASMRIELASPAALARVLADRLSRGNQ